MKMGSYLRAPVLVVLLMTMTKTLGPGNCVAVLGVLIDQLDLIFDFHVRTNFLMLLPLIVGEISRAVLMAVQAQPLFFSFACAYFHLELLRTR